MSLPTSKVETEHDKTYPTTAHESLEVLPTPKVDAVPKSESQSNGFLTAPLSGPIRPLSPDTLSNLSHDEYEQIYTSESTPPLGENHALHPAKGWRGKLQAFWIHNKGLAYMLLAQVFGTLMNVTTRVLEVEGNKGKGMHPFQILFARMGITFALASGWMWFKKTEHFPLGAKGVRWLLVARGFGGFFGVFGMYYSLLYLPLADATVITFLAPGLTCWVCSKVLKEPFTRIEMIGTFVSLVGVVFIARPTSLFAAFGASDAPSPDDQPNGGEPADASNYDYSPIQRLTAVGIALIGVLGTVVAFTCIRSIGKRAHPLISVNYFALWCTLVSLVMMAVLPGVGFALPADLKEWGLLTSLGVSGFIMQFLLAAGLAYEKSSRATNMTYTNMLFALSFDKLIFGHTPGLLSIIGSSLILGSALVVAIQKDSGVKEDQRQTSGASADEESQLGLLRSRGDSFMGDSRDRLPIQEVQLRTLR